MSDNRLLDHATTQYDGQIDIVAAAEDLAERIPDALAPLARIAYNYRWAWLPGGPELFRAVDSERFDLCMRNPVRLLQESPARVLKRAAEDRELVARAQALEAEIAADLERPHAGAPLEPAHPVGFLCAEYGVHVSLPVYSGGLGALAGDLLKEASDQAVPLVAVGLMYRKGYFRQRIDASGWQHEYWIDTDPDRLPAALVTGRDASPVTVTVPIGDNDVVARIWRVDVGRIPLFLLDTDCADNGPMDRWITGRLYDGDPADPPGPVLAARRRRRSGRCARWAMSPGSSTSTRATPRWRRWSSPAATATADGLSQADALDRARSRTVFTTHTPVPAGNDSYPAEEIEDGRRPPGRRARLLHRGAARPRPRRRRRRPGALRRHPGGAADEPWRQRRQPPPRRGGARDVAVAVARALARARSRSATSPTASTSPPGSGGRCASCSIATCPTAGASAPTEPEVWAGRGPDPRRGAVGRRAAASGPSSSPSCGRAASPTAWSAATCAATSMPPRARSTPTC